METKQYIVSNSTNMFLCCLKELMTIENHITEAVSNHYGDKQADYLAEPVLQLTSSARTEIFKLMESVITENLCTSQHNEI